MKAEERPLKRITAKITKVDVLLIILIPIVYVIGTGTPFTSPYGVYEPMLGGVVPRYQWIIWILYVLVCIISATYIRTNRKFDMEA